MAEKHYFVYSDIEPKPEDFEISAANLLARYFCRDAYFVPVSSRKTPDLCIGNTFWEIKSPTGTGSHSIEHQLHRALKQSENIVIDLRRTKLTDITALGRLRIAFQHLRTIKRLVVITKDNKVTEMRRIKRKK